MHAVARALMSALALVSALFLSSGCSDNPAGSGDDVTTRPTLSSLWPNDDRRSWSYDLQGWRWPLTPAPTAQPTALPDPDALWTELWSTPGAEPSDACLSNFQLSFNGTITTSSGVTAQRLAECFDPPMPAGWGSPAFLRGCAWACSGEWIGSYGDVNQELAWKFLDADLKPGHHFTHQIASDIDFELLLHGWIRPYRDVELDGTTYKGCVEVLYALDFANQPYTSEGGEASGYLHLYDLGVVLYAPGVGPIFCRERRRYVQGLNTMGESRLELLEIELIPGQK